MFLGKLIGVLLGFRLASYPGALAGLALGHLLDGWLSKGAWRGWAPWGSNLRRQHVFTEGVVALSAKLAKVDGPVNRAEVEAFKAEFRIPQSQLRAVGQLYDRFKLTADGFEPYARRLGAAFIDAPMLLAGVFEALQRIAAIDGPPDAAERDFLAKVAQAFGLRGGGTSGGQAGAEDPYSVLGVARSASMDEIKAAWRDLTRQHHPDTLIAKGLPQEYVELATRKMAAINAAYDRIRAERGEG